MEAYLAQIMMFGANWAPRSWANCQGQLLAINSNQALFSILGTVYGGDGRTTFALPNMQSVAPIGQGRGPGLSERRIGQRGGQENVTLTQTQMPSHSHQAQAGQAPLTVQNTTANQETPTAASHLSVPFSSGDINTAIYTSGTGNPVNINGGGAPQITVNNAGGSQAHNNMQPFLALNFIICTVGIYPSRN